MILSIDGSNLSHRHFHTIRHQGRLSIENMVSMFMNSIQKAVKDFQPDKIIVSWDYGGVNAYRAALPNYKGDRISVEDDPDLKIMNKSRDILYRLLPILGVASLGRKGYEADDYGYLISHMYPAGIHMTEDIDWYQDIINANWKVWHPIKKKMIDLDYLCNMMETTNNPHKKFIWYKALMGDSSDSIAGIEGIGPAYGVTFATFLHEGMEIPPRGVKAKRVIADMEIVKQNYDAIDLHWMLDEPLVEDDVLKAVELSNVSQTRESIKYYTKRFNFPFHILTTLRDQYVGYSEVL